MMIIEDIIFEAVHNFWSFFKGFFSDSVESSACFCRMSMCLGNHPVS